MNDERLEFIVALIVRLKEYSLDDLQEVEELMNELEERE